MAVGLGLGQWVGNVSVLCGQSSLGGGAQAWDQSDSRRQLHSVCLLLTVGPGVSSLILGISFSSSVKQVREPPL